MAHVTPRFPLSDHCRVRGGIYSNFLARAAEGKASSLTFPMGGVELPCRSRVVDGRTSKGKATAEAG
jgi:hypothetical protein